jgi:hypothetical protein
MQYTQATQSFFQKNKHLGNKVILKDGTSGIKIRLKSKDPATGKSISIGGYWTDTGALVTFWE